MSMCVPFLKNKISDYHFVYLLCEFHCSFSCYYFSRNWTLVKQLNFALLYCITNRSDYRGERKRVLCICWAQWWHGCRARQLLLCAVHSQNPDVKAERHYKSECNNSKDVSFASKTNLIVQCVYLNIFHFYKSLSFCAQHRVAALSFLTFGVECFPFSLPVKQEMGL